MTKLQQMAFNRVIELNGNIKNAIPTRTLRQDFYELTRDEIINIEDFISEQEDWLIALNREEHS